MIINENLPLLKYSEELKKIIELGEENYFIKRQDLEPFLSKIENCSELHLIFYSNVVTQHEAILSTLSIVFRAGKFHYPNKIEELFELSKPFITKAVKHEESILKGKKSAERYRIENSSYRLNKQQIDESNYYAVITNNIAIISKQRIDALILDEIYEACRIFRNASPNLLNSSLLLPCAMPNNLHQNTSNPSRKLLKISEN